MSRIDSFNNLLLCLMLALCGALLISFTSRQTIVIYQRNYIISRMKPFVESPNPLVLNNGTSKELDCDVIDTGVKDTFAAENDFERYGRVWPDMRCKEVRADNQTICTVLHGQISECDRQKLLQIIDVFLVFAKRGRWTYFMGKRLLLGSWRHHGVDPFSRHMSIYVNVSHRISVIETFLGLHGFHIEKEDSYWLNIFPRSSSGLNRPFLEILFYKENTSHVILPSSNDVIEKRLVFPTHVRPVEMFFLEAPKSSAKILYSMYGESKLCGPVGVKVKCSDLDDLIPFVRRTLTDYMGPIQERLATRDITYQFEFPREDLDSISVDPFTLELKKKS